MTEIRNSTVARQLARRVAARRAEIAPLVFGSASIPDGLLDHLREHLAAGETHYTTRPGLPELRRAIGREIGERGGPGRDADGVIVTQGEGEALYVTLLGLGIGAESIVAVAGECAHHGLLELLDIETVDPNDPKAGHAAAVYREIGTGRGDVSLPGSDGRFEILALGGLLFSERSRDTDLASVSNQAIVIGNLDSLPGLDHFRMAYVAGPPDTVKRIQTWKQALSICSAAPSQRAAMFAVSNERVR